MAYNLLTRKRKRVMILKYYTVDGDKLKERRIAKGLSQEKLSKIAGLHKDTIRNKEKTGPQDMREHSVVALANAFACDPRELLYDQEIVAEEDVVEASLSEDTNNVECSHTEAVLEISPYADEPLKMASSGLLKATGSKNRVSYAIASISGYMRSIIWRVPELKFHMRGLVNIIVRSFDISSLDTETATPELQVNLQENLMALGKINSLPEHAKKEAELITGLLARSAETRCNEKLLRTVKAAMYWLRDYWNTVCQDQAAHYALSDVCCMLTGVSDDYATRTAILREVNEFALYVSILDPLYEMMHK